MEKLNSNILACFNAATPEQLREGRDWYRNANNLAYNWADEFNLPLAVVAGGISALSPACSWDRNKIDAYELLRGNKAHKFSSYGPNVLKAQNILAAPEGADISLFFNAKTGAKTLNFYRNILDPSNVLAVTIDRHAAAIYDGREGSGNTPITFARYRLIAQEYMAVANHLGLIPCELQAIVWTVYRERHVAKHHTSKATF